MNEILNKVFLMNTVRDYIICFASLLAGFIALKAARVIIVKRLKALAEKTATKLDDMAVSLLSNRIFPLLYLGVFYVSIQNFSAALFGRFLRQYKNA